jgi:hypothetical protein
MAADWMVEEHEPGWLGRMIAPSGGGRPATAAVAVGALAAVAFVLSMAFDWALVSVTEPSPSEQPSSPGFQAHAGVGTLDSLSFVYALGMVALLGAVGAVVTRPDLALRLRLSALGVTIGMIAVVVAATIRLPTVVLPFGLPSNYPVTHTIELGLFFGYAAVVLPLVSIWLAARPAARTRPAAAPDRDVDEPEFDDEVEPSSVPYLRGLSVSGGGPVDLTVTPG